MISSGEKRWQRGLNTGNAAPNLEEVVIAFHLGGSWRVIGCYGINVAAQQSFPKRFLFGAVAQRRRTLGGRAHALQVFLREKQIMRAGFNRNVDAPRSCLQRGSHSTS